MQLRIATVALALVALTAVAAGAPDPKVLARDRASAAQKVYAGNLSRMAAGVVTAEIVCTWSVRLLDAELAAGTPAKQAFTEHLERMEKVEKAVTSRVTAGTAPSTDADIATYYRIEAALWALNGSRS